MLNQLEEHATTVGVRAIVLSPTRELAIQTSGFVRELGKYLNLRTCVLIGGDSIEAQFAALADNPDVIIATPGRFMHQLVETGMSIKTVSYVVFDEADRLFEMGFADQLREILHRLSDRRQTLLFSATMPAMLAEFARAGLKDPELVRLDVETKLSESLSLSFLSLREEEKLPMLLYLIRQVLGAEEQTIVFAATKHHVEYINHILVANNLPATFIYGDLDPTARKINLAKFRTGQCKVLVVTDVAARGIDVPLLNNVVNYVRHFIFTSLYFYMYIGRGLCRCCLLQQLARHLPALPAMGVAFVSVPLLQASGFASD
jgi:ATP-dependent RNA helicase DDX54/DBP10